jgi:hypothetical protein
MTMLSAKFGENWPRYLPAAVFVYNASTNDATGYTPHALVHSANPPTLLQTLDELADRSSDNTKDVHDHHRQAGARLKQAYKHVREQQERMAKKNREHILKKRGREQTKLVTYEVGDHVLFWEPAQPVKLQTPAQALSNVWVTRAPHKWRSRWSGPHRVTGKASDTTGYRYTIDHKKRGEIITHVNKLCSFHPWATGLLSTSWDIDAKKAANTKEGEWVEVGELVIIPLREPTPFGMARVIECDADGNLGLQWLANDNDDPGGTFKPGWTPKSFKPYYSLEKRKAAHKQYVATLDNIHMNQRDVLFHSFSLTADHHIDPALLRAISRHDCVWWSDKR